VIRNCDAQKVVYEEEESYDGALQKTLIMRRLNLVYKK